MKFCILLLEKIKEECASSWMRILLLSFQGGEYKISYGKQQP
jgi:hypothetical protein